MEFRFHKQLYSDGLSTKKIHTIRKKVKSGSKLLNIFLITLPLGQDGILEIYWYPELLQKEYRSLINEVTVVGLAKSREDAFSLVERIIRDVGINDGNVAIADYFKEKA